MKGFLRRSSSRFRFRCRVTGGFTRPAADQAFADRELLAFAGGMLDLVFFILRSQLPIVAARIALGLSEFTRSSGLSLFGISVDETFLLSIG